VAEKAEGLGKEFGGSFLVRLSLSYLILLIGKPHWNSDRVCFILQHSIENRHTIAIINKRANNINKMHGDGHLLGKGRSFTNLAPSLPTHQSLVSTSLHTLGLMDGLDAEKVTLGNAWCGRHGCLSTCNG
jgi:hypothetical protein